MTHSHFRSLSQDDRYLAVQLARETLSEEVDSAFESGAVWFMYGGRNKKHLTADRYTDIPKRSELRKICEMQNIPLIQYFRGADIDDILLEWRGSCSESVQSYPLIGLSPNGEKDDTVPIHFDTGSPVSFADFDLLNSHFEELDNRDNIDFVPFTVNGVEYQVAHERLSVFFMDVGGGSPKIEINFIVPKMWNDFPNRKRVCSQVCSRRANEAGPKALQHYGVHEHQGKNRYFCRYRWGLIGREFLIENGLKIVLDGKKKIVHLMEDRG